MTILVGIFLAVLCALASAAYLINDAVDAPQDRLHPSKRLRPIAAGLIRPAIAVRLRFQLNGSLITLRIGVGAVSLEFRGKRF